MTIAELIEHTLEETGQSQRAAATELGVSRVTFINWLNGVYVPDPWDDERIHGLADWSGKEYSRLLAMILSEKGIDTSVFEDLVNFAKGVSRGSKLTLATA